MSLQASHQTAELVSAASDAGFTAVGNNVDRVDRDAAGAYAEVGVSCHEVLASSSPMMGQAGRRPPRSQGRWPRRCMRTEYQPN
jgi:hypothetical protein